MAGVCCRSRGVRLPVVPGDIRRAPVATGGNRNRRTGQSLIS
jgi:hypothetical protein